MPIALSPDLRALLKVLMQVDMFRGMYTSQGSGDIVVRRCESWEKIMVDRRRSRRIFKQVKQCVYADLCLLRSHTTCTNFKLSHACRLVQWDVH